MSLLARMEPLADVYDYIHHVWERPRTQRVMAAIIFFIFIGALIGIECNREGFFPPALAAVVPTNHFHAINLAFTLILGMEVMGLILSISCSLSRSLGKQFEIMVLILLRNAFKELAYLPEPVSLAMGMQPVYRIAIAATAALAIFICLGYYHHLRSKQNYIKNPHERMLYVISKKLIALVLLILFIAIATRDGILFLISGREEPFFETIYTVLIFADITLVLIAQRFMPSFHAVFRNSGFVIATLIMRLSLSATSPWDAAASLFAAVYVLGLTWATNRFTPESIRPKGRPYEEKKYVGHVKEEPQPSQPPKQAS
ncbi:MAG: hypothetical protein RRY29_01090 [Desulfovibrionaceae bacterium]